VLPRARGARRLSAAERLQFAEQGFVSGLPVLAPTAGPALVAQFEWVERGLAAQQPPLSTKETFWFFKSSRWFYDLAMLPQIHDYVEDLIGPDFFLWGGAFFAKRPGDETVVPFHQDAQYWDLRRTRPGAPPDAHTGDSCL
jgi:hypothetical protein